MDFTNIPQSCEIFLRNLLQQLFAIIPSTVKIYSMSNRIEEAIARLLIGSNGEILSRVAEVAAFVKLEETSTTCHCYCIKVDGNNNLRLPDLVDYIDEKILEYAIPKKEIDDAKRYMDETGSASKLMRLRRKATICLRTWKKRGKAVKYCFIS